MQKRRIALWTLFLSILFILISIESVTGVGVLEGNCTYNQTISPFGKYFNLTIADLHEMLIFSWIFRILFVVGVLLLYVPNFLLFYESKARSIALIVVNTVGIIIAFLFLMSYSYMLMLITVNLMLFLNVVIQYLSTPKGRCNILIFVSSVFVAFFNIFFLYQHLEKTAIFSSLDVNEVYAMLNEEMISISRINIVCFVLWIIPLILLMVQRRKKNDNGEE